MLKETGVKVQLDTMVLEVTPDKKVHCVSKEYGYQIIEAKSIVLGMGCRERTRGAIGTPGTRPAGVYTAGPFSKYRSGGRSRRGCHGNAFDSAGRG